MGSLIFFTIWVCALVISWYAIINSRKRLMVVISSLVLIVTYSANACATKNIWLIIFNVGLVLASLVLAIKRLNSLANARQSNEKLVEYLVEKFD